jgi:hypothetical protein
MAWLMYSSQSQARRAADEVVKARSDVLASATARLSAEDREALDRVAGQILAGMVRGPWCYALDVPLLRRCRLRPRPGPLSGR